MSMIMSNITTISYQQIIDLEPCYTPESIGINSDYVDTVPNFIRDYKGKVKQLADIIWVLVRKEFISTKQSQLFAIWCARQVQHLMIDQRSIDAIDVAERYINGLATKEELSAAHDAAYAAAYAARADAAYAAAADAAYAAYAAADAAADTAYAAAAAAAAAADAAAAAAVNAAAAAAVNAAAYAMRNKQIDYLLDLFERGANFD